MPPKRRGAQAKSAVPPKVAATPDQPKSVPSSSKSAPTPIPPPTLAPPPPPPESDATRVRKEWTKFIDAWYEPQKKKLVEKLQKDLLVKYKNLGPAKETQKLREMELFEKLDLIAQQLAQPARQEWERRLNLAQLREDQWDDMSGEEQQEVMSVFVGFFADDVEDMDADLSADPSSIEEDDSFVEEPQYRPVPSTSTAPSRQPVPPTPSRGTFEFVNPTSLFSPSITPPNPSKNLPALSMDHLATLGPSNAGRSAEPASANLGGMLGFQNWASEAGIVTQQPQGQSAKPPSVSSSAQTLSARPRATDNMSRQASAASNLSSPPLKSSSPQYSPPNHASPPINAENLPLGKRYIGPIITEEDPDPKDEKLLRSKMAADYQQYKVSLRIQMIYQFHAEAADIEIKLFETLLADEGTKESRARAVQEHETSMMRLREQKEEERKRLCAEEREKRLEEIQQHLAQRRSAPNRDVDPGPSKANLPRSMPDKTSVQPQRLGKVAHQKENVAVPPPVSAVPTTKLEPPSLMKKSISTLSQDEASANEALFANAMATMAGKAGATGLTPAQASLNESLFASAAAKLTAQGQQPGSSAKNTLHPPSIMKKSNSARSQDHNVPQITVSFAEPPPPVAAPELAQMPPTTAKGKKGKKAQLAVQIPPTKPVTITEEPDMDAEPPPPTASLWDTAAVVAKSAWGAASASVSASTAKFNVSVEDEESDHVFFTVHTPVSSKGNATTKKTVPATNKGKKVTITEESDVDADPIVSPAPTSKVKAAKGGWGPANGKSRLAPTVVEETEPEPAVLPPPPVTSAWGKKTAQAANGKSKLAPTFVEESEPEPPIPPPSAPVTSAWGKKTAQANVKASAKPQLKVAISKEPESESEVEPVPAPAPARTNKGKSAWGAPSTTPSTGASTKAGKKATQQQAEPRRGGATPSLKSARVEVVPEPEDAWVVGDSAMPGALELAASEEAEEDEEEEVDASAWFKPENVSYWANFMADPPEPEPEVESPPAAEPAGKHVRWTPTVSGESDDEEGMGDGEAELANNVWMQYAISGGDIPAFGGAEEPHFTMSESAPVATTTSVREQGKGKKPHSKNPIAGDFGNRAQQTSVFDRAAFTGQQWPKMESWLSPSARGQSSGSARVF